MDKSWKDDAACAAQNRTEQTEKLDWFSTDKAVKYDARAVCRNACPVRQECMQAALDNRELHGIWGGVDDYEIRRAMSVDANGDVAQRDRAPRCPYCLNRKLDIATSKTGAKGYATNCPKCGLHWYMAAVPQKVKAKK